ncbi:MULTISPECIES: hypothetical protein [Nocardia]|uniref:hypothetical protein n=1 Tax=Nocardia TaxID=1817 RepID=UPI00255CC561|nr:MULTISPECIES: hypothetical protein [Nocardia]
MTSGFERRPNDPSGGEQGATEKIHRRPPGSGAADVTPTQAIQRTTSPADTTKTEMFRVQPPNSGPPRPPGPPQQQPASPPHRTAPTPAPPRESTPNLDRDAATRALQSLASAGRSSAQDEPTRPMSGINPAMRGFDPAATRAMPPNRPPNHPAQQHFPPNGPGRPQPEQAWQLGAPTEQVATQQYPARKGDSAPYPPPATGTDGSDEPPSSRKRWILAGVGVVAVAAVAGAVALVSTRDQAEAPATQAAPSPSMVSALTSSRSAAPSSTRPAPSSTAATTTNRALSAAQPLIPGYQAVVIRDRGAAYDIPMDWKIDPVGTATLGNPPDAVEIAGRTTEGDNYCPRMVRSSAFLTMSPQADPAAAAADVGMRMIKVGWPTATGATPGKAEQLTSLDGQLHGAFVETTGTATPPAPGCAKTFAVYTFAFPSENGHFVMTIAADTGVAKAIDKETAKKMLASIRPLPER